MTTCPGSVAVGIVGPGAMGVALGRCFAAGGHPVLTTAAGRSESTARRLAEADIADAGSLDAVVAGAAVVVSVVPPAQARGVADELAASASRTSAAPLVVEANAVSPGTVTDVAARLGLDLVDAAISGPPPSPDSDRPTRVFLSGPRSAEVASLGVPGVRWIEITGDLGAASAARCAPPRCARATRRSSSTPCSPPSATAWWTRCSRTCSFDYPRDDVRQAAVAATKAWRFADEMEEIAATQGEAGPRRHCSPRWRRSTAAWPPAPSGRPAPRTSRPRPTSRTCRLPEPGRRPDLPQRPQWRVAHARPEHRGQRVRRVVVGVVPRTPRREDSKAPTAVETRCAPTPLLRSEAVTDAQLT